MWNQICKSHFGSIPDGQATWNQRGASRQASIPGSKAPVRWAARGYGALRGLVNLVLVLAARQNKSGQMRCEIGGGGAGWQNDWSPQCPNNGASGVLNKAEKQASKQASEQSSKEGNNQAMKQANSQTHSHTNIVLMLVFIKARQSNVSTRFF